MNTQYHDSLEEQLTHATKWSGAHPEPELWQRSLEAEARRKSSVGVFGRQILNWSMPKALAAAIVLLVTSAIVITLLLPAVGRARVSARAAIVSPNSVDYNDRSVRYVDDAMGRTQGFEGAPSLDLNGALNQGQENAINGMAGGYPVGETRVNVDDLLRIVNGWEGYKATASGDLVVDQPASANLHSAAIMSDGYGQDSNSVDSDQSQDRSVIRKATIELVTDDVRAAFAKALHIISEAGGEYVQDSGLTGADKDAQATLTLRVRADRLSAVLNELRELGVVHSEKLTGEDVTAQIVDLEARHRNEQRVEKELLELMEKRQDAPLKEILELRSSISSVRQTIEQLTAQRERLGRLVSLATVLVIIRPEPLPVEEPKQQETKSIGAYFGESLVNSWHDGLHYLADALAGTLRILVGGLIWWCAAVVVLLTLRAHLQRRAFQQ